MLLFFRFKCVLLFFGILHFEIGSTMESLSSFPFLRSMMDSVGSLSC